MPSETGNNTGPQVNIVVHRTCNAPTSGENFNHFPASSTTPLDDVEARQDLLNQMPGYENRDVDDVNKKSIKEAGNIICSTPNKEMYDILDRSSVVIISSLVKQEEAVNLMVNRFNLRPDGETIDLKYIQDIREFQKTLWENMQEDLPRYIKYLPNSPAEISQQFVDDSYSIDYEDVSRPVVAHLFNQGVLDPNPNNNSSISFPSIEFTPVEGLTEEENEYIKQFAKDYDRIKENKHRVSIIMEATFTENNDRSREIIEEFNAENNKQIDFGYIKTNKSLLGALQEAFVGSGNDDLQSERMSKRALSHLIKYNDLENAFNTDLAFMSDNSFRDIGEVKTHTKFDDLIMSEIKSYNHITKIPGFTEEQNKIIEGLTGKLVFRPTETIFEPSVAQLKSASNKER